MKSFNHYLDKKLVKKQTPDISRANSLIDEAKQRMNFLKTMIEKIKINDQNSNYFIENSYDILIELTRARMLQAGYKSSGIAAHEAEVSFLETLNFKRSDIDFLDELRFFRNKIKYYGKKFDSEYANKVINYLNKNYPKLIN